MRRHAPSHPKRRPVPPPAPEERVPIWRSRLLIWLLWLVPIAGWYLAEQVHAPGAVYYDPFHAYGFVFDLTALIGLAMVFLAPYRYDGTRWLVLPVWILYLFITSVVIDLSVNGFRMKLF